MVDDPSRLCHTPSSCVEITRHPPGEAQLSEGAIVVELFRQYRCGAGWRRRAISAQLPPRVPPGLCREISTEAEAASGYGGGRIARLREVPRQRRVCPCALSCAGPGSCPRAEIYIPGNDIPCTISGTQCLATRRGAADQPERSPWILPRSRSFSLATPTDVRRPLRRPRSCDCSIRRLWFLPALGWCWRGGGW